ncbi:hypothetical protein Angca_007694, partial [Angiostrongylus cantonensis]
RSGNGPAGLALSAFLSGVLPYYNPNAPHPDPTVDEKLRENLCQSLIDQVCFFFSRHNVTQSGCTKLAPLIEILLTLILRGLAFTRCADLTKVSIFSEFCWFSHCSPQVGLAKFFPRSIDILIFQKRLKEVKRTFAKQLDGSIENYHSSYEDYLYKDSHTFLHFKKTGGVWSVSGKRLDGMSFSYTANHVILACGLMKKRPLELPTQNYSLPVVYDVLSMRSQLAQHDCNSDTSVRVVVVGDGITSADAVRVCLEHEVPVLHLMRRTERQIQNSVLSRLSPLHYLEYHSIYRLMIGKDSHPLYVKRHASSIISVDENSVLTISTSKEYQYEKCSLLVVCIGRVSDFDGILVGKYTFTGYHSEEDPTLMRVGSFAGDNLVRYIVGGCLDVARSLHNLYRNKNSS